MKTPLLHISKQTVYKNGNENGNGDKKALEPQWFWLFLIGVQIPLTPP